MRHQRSRSVVVCRVVGMALLAGLTLSTPLVAAPGVFHFDLPEEDLGTALASFSKITGIAVKNAEATIGSVKVAGLHGDFSPKAALIQLLGQTGLTFDFAGDSLVTVSRLGGGPVTGIRSGGGDGKMLAPVLVEGATSNATAGANGSSDVTATEGTQSYTTDALNIGSKIPHSIKDTPQSVTVVTRQRMQDQHLNNLTDALEQTPGVTVLQGGSFGSESQLTPHYYSRGFEIQNFQIDGGAPLTYGSKNFISNLTPIFDASEYDHFEILRGAAGQYTGVGDPGGVVSLERKRPVDHAQFLVDGSYGSFKDGRVSLDASSPVSADGKLRARAVVTHEGTDYFYTTANKKLDMFYLNLEAEVTPDTVVNLGTSHTDQRAVPWFFGLPRYSSGADLNLPRSVCLCTDWSVYQTHQLEYFAQLRQHFGPDWSAQVNLTANQQQSAMDTAGVQAQMGIDPTTLQGAQLSGSRTQFQSNQYIADGSINGKFEVFGLKQEVTLGGNYQLVDAKDPSGANANGSYTFSGVYPNVFSFDPGAYPPSGGVITPAGFTVLSQGQTQWGSYLTFRLTPWEPLHFTIGDRVNAYDTRQQTRYSSFGLPFDQNTHYKETTVLPPFFGVTYDLTHDMSVYANDTAIYQSQANQLTRNGNSLPPVTGTNYEVGLKRADFGGTLNTSLAAYYIKQINGAQADTSAPATSDPGSGISCCYVASDQNISKGVDFEVNGALTPRWQIATGYTYNFNQYTPGPASVAFGATAAPLVSRAPEHLFKLWTTYKLSGNDILDRLQVGFGARIQSATYVSGSVCDANFNCNRFNFTQGGYGVFDGMLKYDFNDHAYAQLNVKNILDRTYYQTVGSVSSGNWYGVPRSFTFSMHAQF